MRSDIEKPVQFLVYKKMRDCYHFNESVPVKRTKIAEDGCQPTEVLSHWTDVGLSQGGESLPYVTFWV